MWVGVHGHFCDFFCKRVSSAKTSLSPFRPSPGGGWHRYLRLFAKRKSLGSSERPIFETPLGPRDHAIIVCLSELGLRGADVANLEIDGVDFTARVLRLRQRKEREAVTFPMTRPLCSALKASQA